MVPVFGRVAAIGALLAALCGPAHAQSGTSTGSEYIEAKDREVAAQAQAAVDGYCADYPRGELDRDEGLESLEDGEGGDNILYNALSRAESGGEVMTELQEEITISWIFFKIIPILMALVVLIAWCVCCWGPCCKCCRRCGKYNPTSPVLKGVGFGLLFLLIIGAIVASYYSFKGYSYITDGFENVACSSARLLNTSLAGNDDPQFIGLMPVLEAFSSLDQKFDNSSTFITQVNALLANTAKLTEAVTVASNTLGLLKRAMEDPANADPSSGGQSLLHKCGLCDVLPAVLTPVISALENGVAAALNNARDEVQKQLTPQKRQDLQNILRTTTTPLVELKKLMRDSMKTIIDQNNYNAMTDFLDTQLLGLCTLICMIFFMLLCCGCCSMGLWVGMEKDKRQVEAGANPYLLRGPRCAECSWCCGFCFAFVAFLVGGIIILISVPLSGVCLIMDSLGGGLLRDISDAVSLNMTSDDGIILESVADKCLSRQNQDANMLDLLFIRDENNTQVYLRQRFVTDLTDMVSGKFGEVTTKMNNMSLTLGNMSEVISLRGMLRDNPMDAMIFPSPELASDALYQDLSRDARGDNGLIVGFQTTASCSNHTTGAGMGSMANTIMPGIDHFMGRLDYFGTRAVTTTCAANVNCRGNLNADEALACSAGNRYVTLKNQLLGLSNFKCPQFRLANGNPCDVKNMVFSGGQWNNDCVLSDGSMDVQDATCTLPELVQYVQDFDIRINKVLQRLDNDVAAVANDISVGLVNLVNTMLIDPLIAVAEGLRCSWLGQFYHQFVGGVCFQGVYGFRILGWSYVAIGAMTTTFIALMYTVWRRGVDNKALWTADGAPAPSDAQSERNWLGGKKKDNGMTSV